MTALELPAENRELSPCTGWTREHWAAIADHLLLSLRPYFSSTRSRVSLPGQTSSSGVDSDGLEGYARSFMLFAFRLTGERGVDPHGFTQWYRDGMLAGTDPSNAERWPTGVEVNQAKVEAASLALGLQLTRPWLWDTFDDAEKQQVIAWLELAADGWYPDNNWLWFRITVETFLASVGGTHDPARIAQSLATIESYYRADGWYADGELRAYDYYCGWAMHLYPLLWAASEGSAAFGSGTLEPVFRARLSEFLDDFVCLIGGDGMPVLEGRSLIYRFAAAAPLWMGAVSGATSLSPGTIRRAASGVLRAFVERDGIDERGLLTMGLYGEWPAMAQSYSGPGSPYWASKGMLGLLLPAEHPVWQAVEEPLPVEIDDVRRVVRPAGWIISGTASDGIVRVFNHGADHALPGDTSGDSPLYARFGYSSATIPPLVGSTLDSPVDNAAGVLDAAGASTHRTGFDRGVIGDDGTAAFATSTTHAHWVDSSGYAGHDHGSGRTGRVTEGPELRCASVVRGAWEVRAVLVGDSGAGARGQGAAAGADAVRLRVSGWPLTANSVPVEVVAEGTARVETNGLVAELRVLGGRGAASVHRESGTSPIGEHTAVPWLEFDAVAAGDAVITASRLGRSDEDAPTARVQSGTLVVGWPDGALSTVALR
ncbi:DUF2264 domain-containing protein [Humibacter ginsenosidimutans]|uniref:DUF2264 domain-containing protein n=1 Tax=Humibacter ginsenosidimutans TaxID=2599293 RepID=A0A5B8M876_9MICO|nr:DUF2264 domain-containing protein [Humibacter ginsenosidimutans]QDZ16224.1 DUF2264 domain-containing protein [Humibacter ginsenosidimutans]